MNLSLFSHSHLTHSVQVEWEFDGSIAESGWKHFHAIDKSIRNTGSIFSLTPQLLALTKSPKRYHHTGPASIHAPEARKNPCTQIKSHTAKPIQPHSQSNYRHEHVKHARPRAFSTTSSRGDIIPVFYRHTLRLREYRSSAK